MLHTKQSFIIFRQEKVSNGTERFYLNALAWRRWTAEMKAEKFNSFCGGSHIKLGAFIKRITMFILVVQDRSVSRPIKK